MTIITTFFGAGYLRPAPGTWASAIALALGVAIDRWLGYPALVVATVLAIALGLWACKATLAPGEDPGHVVIDEVAGQWLTLLFPAAAFWSHGVENWAVVAYPGWVASFVFFRLFDIWKPWPVSWADRELEGGLGVMADDMLAGLLAGIVVLLVRMGVAL